MIEEYQFYIPYPSMNSSELVLFKHDNTYDSLTSLGLLLNNIEGALETYMF